MARRREHFVTSPMLLLGAADEWEDVNAFADMKTVVTKKAAAGDVTVTATPKPVMTEANLPAGWLLSGGTGAGNIRAQ